MTAPKARIRNACQAGASFTSPPRRARPARVGGAGRARRLGSSVAADAEQVERRGAVEDRRGRQLALARELAQPGVDPAHGLLERARHRLVLRERQAVGHRERVRDAEHVAQDVGRARLGQRGERLAEQRPAQLARQRGSRWRARSCPSARSTPRPSRAGAGGTRAWPARGRGSRGRRAARCASAALPPRSRTGSRRAFRTRAASRARAPRRTGSARSRARGAGSARSGRRSRPRRPR